MNYKTVEVISELMKNKNLRFRTVINDKEFIACVNQNNGISIGKNNLNMSGEILNAVWEVVNKRYSFMEAINSGKRIKHESWKAYRTIEEALYDLIDDTVTTVIGSINGAWNIEGE